MAEQDKQDKTPQADPKSDVKDDAKADAKADKSVDESVEKKDGRPITFWIAVAMGGIVGLFVLLLVGSVFIAAAFGEHDSVADWVSIIRDLFIILLAMEGMVMGFALIVLVIQLAALLNVLQNEVQPIVDNANETVSTVRGTAQFMSQNLVEPVVKMSALAAGVSGVLREVIGIRRALNQAGKNGATLDETKVTPDS